MSEVFGHVRVRRRVRVRSHNTVHVRFRVHVRSTEKSYVRVRTFCRPLQWRKTEIENFDSKVHFKLITKYQSVRRICSHRAIYQLQDDSLPVILSVLPV